jgi:hypothetical protein
MTREVIELQDRIRATARQVQRALLRKRIASALEVTPPD